VACRDLRFPNGRAFVGAWVLLQMSDLKPLYEYSLGDRVFTITPLKLVIAILLVFFSRTHDGRAERQLETDLGPAAASQSVHSKV
jgi:hypothetical protein